MPTRPAITETNERLAAIEERLAHMATREQLAELRQDVRSIEKQMPLYATTATRVEHNAGWREAKEDSQSDQRGIMAVGVAFIALLVSGASALWDMIGGSGQ